MKKVIKIDGEEKKRHKLQPPPTRIVFEYPKEKVEDFVRKEYKEMGLSKLENAMECEEKEVHSSFFGKLDFYIKEDAFKKMLSHCHKMASEHKEAMGFLIGDIKYWDEEYSVVYEIATASLDSSPFYVRFSREAFEELFDKLDEIEYEYILVGWYHSHVGYTSFMSGIDLETQKKYFNQPFHAAVVIDPIKMEVKAFRLHNDECIEIPYAVFI